MNLLGAKLYDPGTAATKATTSLLAMTALDTTNLRLTVTVPAHGFLRVKMRCNIFGATTFPQILLGVMVSTVVAGRVAPQITIDGTALATTFAVADADFVIAGLSPGSTVFDAAYAVQTVVASSNIKYGGPDDNSGADAWGAFAFELWDPVGLTTAAIATAVLTTQMTESYAALHAAPTLAQAQFETRAILAENSVSATTVTTKKIDGSTTAHTYTINSATTPTSITTAS